MDARGLCIESLITAADELDAAAPDTKLTQANHRKHQVGRRNIASTIGGIGAAHRTTFKKLPDAVIKWRAGDRQHELGILVKARRLRQEQDALARGAFTAYVARPLHLWRPVS